MDILTLDLDHYRTPGVRCYSGRDRGDAVGQAAGVAAHLVAGGVVHVRIPADTFSLGSGFVLALFGDVVREIGRERMETQITFEGPPHLVGHVRTMLEDSFNTASPFPPIRP